MTLLQNPWINTANGLWFNAEPEGHYTSLYQLHNNTLMSRRSVNNLSTGVLHSKHHLKNVSEIKDHTSVLQPVTVTEYKKTVFKCISVINDLSIRF